jgi:predicted ester cyclase
VVTQRDEHRSLYLSYLRYCNEHDFDRMASFYTSTIKVNDVPMDPAAVTAQFAPLISAFPDWHWEIRHIVVDGDYIAVHFTVTGTHRGAFQGIEATDRRVTISEFIAAPPTNVRFAPKSGHRNSVVECPLCAKSRHSHCSDLRSPQVLI